MRLLPSVASFAPLMLGLLGAGTVVHAADPNTGVTLQVQVDLPDAHQPNPDPSLISAFVARIRAAFEQQGYAGAIAEASTGRDVPNETAVLLRINVTDLRVRDDRLDARFTATLRTHAEELELGQFRDRDLRWQRDSGQLGPTPAGSDSTMLRLYQAMAGSRLVPGLGTS